MVSAIKGNFTNSGFMKPSLIASFTLNYQEHHGCLMFKQRSMIARKFYVCKK